jgi:hypothetical protein
MDEPQAAQAEQQPQSAGTPWLDAGDAASQAPQQQQTQSSQGTPVQTEQTPATGNVQQQQEQQYATPPKVLVPEKRGGLGGIVDELRNALVPQTADQVYRDPETGERFVQTPSRTPGQQWRKLGAEAITGAIAGMGVGPGRGKAGLALKAGYDQQQKQAQQEKQAQENEQDEDYQIARQNRIDKANTYLQQQQMAVNAFNLTRLKARATQEDVGFQQQQEDREKALGSVDLGTYPDHLSLADVQKVHPEFWKSAVNGDVRSIPAFDADGNRAGVHMYLRQAGIGDQPADPGTQAMRFVQGEDPKQPPKLVPFTPTGTHTQNEIDNYNAAAYKQMQTWQSAQAEAEYKKAQEGNVKSETAEHYSMAEKNRLESKQLNEATEATSVQSNAQQLVEGNVDPSNLSKRSKSYDATLAQANAYSMQKYGTPFDVAKAARDYKAATNPTTISTLNYLNSLVGPNNNGGNLSELVKASDAMPRGQFPPLNDTAQWLKLQTGNSQVAAYHATLTEVSDQIAKILQGGGTGGGTSDAKLKQAQDLFQKGFTKDQIKSVANDSLRPLLANRKAGIIGDNRYLLKWTGQQPQQQQQQGQQPQQATPTPQTHIFSPSAWKTANPGKNVNEAIADAKQKGFTVGK